MPRVDTALFLFFNLLLFAATSFLYNLHVIVKHISSPLTSDIVACFFVMSLAFLWSFAFLGWLQYTGLKKRLHAVIGFFCAILFSLKLLGVWIILNESQIAPAILAPIFSVSLKLSCVYLVMLILWQGLKDKTPLNALLTDKRYLQVFILVGIFYILSFLSGPGHISSADRFALSAAEKYYAEVKKSAPRRAPDFQKDINFYERMYTAGRADAAVYLGIFYEVSGDMSAAEDWYSTAASLVSKNVENQKSLDSGSRQEAGLTLQRDRAQALAGNSSAIFLYATLLDMQAGATDIDVLPLYEQAASLGHKEAAGILADYYWVGKNTKPNFNKACRWGVTLSSSSSQGLRYRVLCRLVHKGDL